MTFTIVCWQESDSVTTNNGIHYRLQLLYSNGAYILRHSIRAY